MHFEPPSNFDSRKKDPNHLNLQGHDRLEEEEVNYGTGVGQLSLFIFLSCLLIIYMYFLSLLDVDLLVI